MTISVSSILRTQYRVVISSPVIVVVTTFSDDFHLDQVFDSEVSINGDSRRLVEQDKRLPDRNLLLPSEGDLIVDSIKMQLVLALATVHSWVMGDSITQDLRERWLSRQAGGLEPIGWIEVGKEHATWQRSVDPYAAFFRNASQIQKRPACNRR